MNNNYFPNPTFPGANSLPTEYENQLYTSDESSYIENILRLNKGKMAKVYCSYPDSSSWQNKIFEGRIEEAGKDHLIVSNPTNGEWYMILLIYINFVTFDEKSIIIIFILIRIHN